MYRKRIQEFQKYLKRENLDGFFVKRPHHIRYLCGFTGDMGLLVILQKAAYLLCDGRFHEQARIEVKGAKVVPVKGYPLSELKELGQFRGKNLKYGYESEFLTCEELKIIQESLPQAILVSTTGAVDLLSITKDKFEIENIKKAVEIADTAFERILGYLSPGLRENEVCAELEYQMKMLGSEKPAFDTIIASGYRSALPHGQASDKKIKKGEFITFDFGATYNGYVSDMTRTVVLGKATSRQKKVYNTVLKAQLAGIRKVKAGVEAKAVDAVARKVIEKQGFGKYFTHGTGHGIGFYVHVRPVVSTKSEAVLKSGMVITVEPGIYIPKWGGVRIEDDIVVTKNGGRVLNRAPKKLLEV